MAPDRGGGSTAAESPRIPLVRRFPALATLPRAQLCRAPTPVESMGELATGLWVKREDLSAEPLGGNKARALEFLLGGVAAGDLVVTVGAAGSTHALATIIHARRIGALPLVYRWPQEMNPVAQRVSERIAAESGGSVSRTLIGAYARAFVARVRGAHWIPAGGSSALGVLGQVNAALELADQVSAGILPRPDRIVLPLGTGGTAAGISLGLAIAGLRTTVVAVRVVPRLVANLGRVRRLARDSARLLARATGETIPRPSRDAIRIEHAFFGGAYGRPAPLGAEVAARCLHETGIAVDPTYSAKALAAAVAVASREGGTTLFWLSFDGRWLAGSA